MLVSASYDKAIKLWDMSTYQVIKTLEGHTDRIFSISINAQRKLMASGGDDKIIKIWSMETFQEIKSLTGHENYINNISFSHDGKLMISCSNKVIIVWDAETFQEVKKFTDLYYSAEDVTFSPDSKYFAAGLGGEYIKIWNSKTFNCELELRGHENYIKSICFSPDGT